MATVAAIALVGSMGVSTYAMLQGNIQSDNVDHLLGTERPSVAAPTATVSDPTDPFGGQALNILLMGSDSRWGDNASVGGEYDGMRADTTMLAHISADRSRIDIVSIPRDTMVDIPSCQRNDGSTSKAQFGQFNSAFNIGGQDNDVASAAACAQRTVESITNIRIDGYIVVDMMGFADVIQTLGGIDVCVPQDINLPKWGLVLSSGMQHLNGTEGLAYARVRHGIGDGSDLQRIERQKVVMSAIAHKALDSSMLTNPPKLLQFLNATTSTIHASSAMASLSNMAGLGFSLRNMSLDHITFLTAPVGTYPKDHNRVEFTSAASEVWDLLRTDQPIPGSVAYQQAQAAAAAAAGTDGTGTNPGSTGGSTDGQASGTPDTSAQQPQTQPTDPATAGTSSGIVANSFKLTDGTSSTTCGQ